MAALVSNTDASETPLHVAASLGDFQEVCVLVHKGEMVNASRSDGKTPLMLAVTRNCPETVDALLFFGADFDVADDDGKSALKLAFEHEDTHHEIVEKFLLQVEEKETEIAKVVEKLLDVGCTLYHAAFGGNVKLMKAFLQSGIDVDSTGFKGRTALHVAVDAVDQNAVTFLLNEGANVNVVDDEGLGALCIAAANGNAIIVRLLLERGADPNAKAFDYELTPLIAALENSDEGRYYEECVELLLEFGAVPSQKVGEYATVLDEALDGEMCDYKIDLLVCHVALKEMQGVQMVDKMIQCKLDEHQDAIVRIREYYEMCQMILRVKVFKSYSLFDLLSVSERKLRMLMRNEMFDRSVTNILDEVRDRYRFYYITLLKRLENAPGAGLENEAMASFCKIFDGNYNRCYVVARQVVGYLDKRDLELLREV